jgi:hypothetical protein
MVRSAELLVGTFLDCLPLFLYLGIVAERDVQIDDDITPPCLRSLLHGIRLPPGYDRDVAMPNTLYVDAVRIAHDVVATYLASGLAGPTCTFRSLVRHSRGTPTRGGPDGGTADLSES